MRTYVRNVASGRTCASEGPSPRSPSPAPAAARSTSIAERLALVRGPRVPLLRSRALPPSSAAGGRRAPVSAQVEPSRCRRSTAGCARPRTPRRARASTNSRITNPAFTGLRLPLPRRGLQAQSERGRRSATPIATVVGSATSWLRRLSPMKRPVVRRLQYHADQDLDGAEVASGARSSGSDPTEIRLQRKSNSNQLAPADLALRPRRAATSRVGDTLAPRRAGAAGWTGSASLGSRLRPSRGVAQPGRAPHLGSRRPPVQIRSPRSQLCAWGRAPQSVHAVQTAQVRRAITDR